MKLRSFALPAALAAASLSLAGCATMKNAGRYDFQNAQELDDYTIYYSLGSPALSQAGRDTIKASLNDTADGSDKGYIVDGYTDSSGETGDNQALSKARADSVASALTSMGVARDRILVHSFGESNPAKNVPKGTAEPLNRRVEVTRIRFR